MIPERIQNLYREAVFKTCVQGKRAGYDRSPIEGDFQCLYTDQQGNHCAVGHALTPELQDKVGDAEAGVHQICSRWPEVAEHLGVCAVGLHNQVDTALWADLQTTHDGLREAPRENEWQSERRPFGVSWSAYLWYRARTVAQRHGFDIGNYPRREVQDAQAA